MLGLLVEVLTRPDLYECILCDGEMYVCLRSDVRTALSR